MTLTTVKERLYEYIGQADEKKVQTIYTLIESEIDDTKPVYDDETLAILEQRREKFVRNGSKGFSVEESIAHIKEKKIAYELIITQEEEDNVADACIYYDDIQEDLSDRFLSGVLDIYQALQENPQYFGYIHFPQSTLRDIKLRKFPYAVIFDINRNFVAVYSVFHTSRRPKFR